MATKRESMKENSKVFVITNMFPSKKYPHYGVFVKNVIDGLKSRGIKVSVAKICKKDTFVFKTIGYIFFYLHSIIKLLFLNFDAIYIHYPSHTYLPVKIALLFKRLNLITNVHGNDLIPEDLKDKQKIKYTEEALKRSNYVIVPSEYFKSYVVENFSIKDDKIVIYPSGGVNKNAFFLNDKIVREPLSICFASRIEKDKGWDLYVKLIKRLLDENLISKALLIGDGSQKSMMYNLMNSLHIEDKIICYDLMSQNQLSDIFNSIDIFVFPTYRKSESLGLVGLEAMACGAIVIGPDKYGPTSYCHDGIDSIVFKSGDLDDLYKKAVYALSLDQIQKECIRKKAIRNVIDFDSENGIEKIARLFEKQR